jgi:hypothetical protein
MFLEDEVRMIISSSEPVDSSEKLSHMIRDIMGCMLKRLNEAVNDKNNMTDQEHAKAIKGTCIRLNNQLNDIMKKLEADDQNYIMQDGFKTYIEKTDKMFHEMIWN